MDSLPFSHHAAGESGLSSSVDTTISSVSNATETAELPGQPPQVGGVRACMCVCVGVCVWREGVCE